MSQVRIELTGPGRGKVFVDGVELPGVRAIDLSAGIDRANLVILELIPETVEVTALDCEVKKFMVPLEAAEPT